MDSSTDNIDVEDQQDIDEDLVRKLANMEADLTVSSDNSNIDYNCDSTDSVDLEAIDDDIIRLTDLPAEILIHIASFLDSRSVILSLYPTCRQFYELFANYKYWKTRISQRWPKQFPIFEADNFNWRRACMEREEVHQKWSDPDIHFDHFKVTEGFFAAVDCVHLMKGGRCLAIGSRDRHLNILDLTRYNTNNGKPNHQEMVAVSDTKTHKGWVWSMASHDNTLVTGSWDAYVRLWDTGSENVQLASEIKIKTAALCLHYEPNFIATGGFDKRLHILDPRDPDSRMRKSYHTQPILSMVADDKYVITGSEDKTIAIYDRAAGKKYKQIQTESFVMSMSYGEGALWFGDKEGRISVLDAQHGLFEEASQKTFDIGHKGRLTGITHTPGGIFTCCTDGQLKVVEPSIDPATINTLTVHSADIAGLSYKNGILASAGSDICVGLWLPKDRPF